MRIEFDGGSYTRLRCVADAIAIVRMLVLCGAKHDAKSVRWLYEKAGKSQGKQALIKLLDPKPGDTKSSSIQPAVSPARTLEKQVSWVKPEAPQRGGSASKIGTRRKKTEDVYNEAVDALSRPLKPLPVPENEEEEEEQEEQKVIVNKRLETKEERAERRRTRKLQQQESKGFFDKGDDDSSDLEEESSEGENTPIPVAVAMKPQKSSYVNPFEEAAKIEQQAESLKMTPMDGQGEEEEEEDVTFVASGGGQNLEASVQMMSIESLMDEIEQNQSVMEGGNPDDFAKAVQQQMIDDDFDQMMEQKEDQVEEEKEEQAEEQIGKQEEVRQEEQIEEEQFEDASFIDWNGVVLEPTFELGDEFAAN